jgi:hypothetical protein
MNYTTPEDTYDLPFIWVFDASQLVDGQDYPNQIVYLQGGYGDFILRRVVGIRRILNPATGQVQVRDNEGNYIQSAPVFATSQDDLCILPELRYQELGGIRFDLGKVLKP